ncbi:MAG TPA: VOC family protein [Rhodocyclaceae bacterium]|nr:VOC family protein [Rhodocyclaceae bacterium]
MAEISNLGYLIFGASDLGKWEEFAVNIVGMQVGKKDDRSLALRMDEYEQRILIEKKDHDDLTEAGWLFDTEGELETYVQQLAAKGVKVTKGSSELAATRRVEQVYWCDDPSGFRHEFAFGPAYAPIAEPFHSAVLRGGFETGSLGVGHFLAVARNPKESVTFYRDALGLRVSDYIRQELAPGLVADATFFHSRTGRHHSLASCFIPGAPKRLNHFMVQVNEMDDVGLAYDRCLKAGVPIYMGIGHHPNDHMISFYAVTPSGFAMEFGYGGLVIDDSDWEVKSYRQLSDWGHHRGAGFVAPK